MHAMLNIALFGVSQCSRNLSGGRSSTSSHLPTPPSFDSRVYAWECSICNPHAELVCLIPRAAEPIAN
jgi:hypothetical protein